jgi:endonuclease/exonuclease/phosphatase family metal-dependent hydrolase
LNVWGLPEPLADHVSERMRAIGARLAEFDLDVVALQEVWTPGVRDALRAAGRRAGRLMVLSRLPIEAARFEPFAVRGVPRHADYYGGKGFAALRLRGPDGPITLVDTHLHARHARSVDHQFVPHRVGQIVQIALAVLQIPDPVLAAGDFNSAEGEPEHLVLEGLTGLRDVAAELDRRQPTVLRANPYRTRSTKPDRRIDFLFARDGASLRATPARVERVFDGVFEHDGASLSCSNHAGVLAEIEIEPARRATPPGADPDAVVRAARRPAGVRGRPHPPHDAPKAAPRDAPGGRPAGADADARILVPLRGGRPRRDRGLPDPLRTARGAALSAPGRGRLRSATPGSTPRCPRGTSRPRSAPRSGPRRSSRPSRR